MLFVGHLVLATGHGRLDVDQTREHLLRLIASSRAPGADETLDCSWRRLAFEYAPTLLSARLFSKDEAKRLHDALELSALCGEAFHYKSPVEAKSSQQLTTASFASSIAVFVSPNGADTAAGTLHAPLLSIHAAIAMVRAKRGGTPPSAANSAIIYLRAGTYHLADHATSGGGGGSGPLELHHIDSHLTFSAYQGEAAVVSGATLLSNLKWSPPQAAGQPHVATLSAAQAARIAALGGIPALRVASKRATRARYPNANPELDLFPIGYVREHTTWLPPTYPPYNAPSSKPCAPRSQCGTSTNVSIPAPASEWHGMYQSYAQGCVCARASSGTFQARMRADGCLVLWAIVCAHCPRCALHCCALQSLDSILPSSRRPPTRASRARRYGGACEVYEPPRSAWCSGNFYLERQFPEMHSNLSSRRGSHTRGLPVLLLLLLLAAPCSLCGCRSDESAARAPAARHPSGILPQAHLPHSPYKEATGAHIIAWRPHHWYTWMWEVAEASVGPNPNQTAFLFGSGGNQGGEGADYADEWWIDNVAEGEQLSRRLNSDVRRFVSCRSSGSSSQPQQQHTPPRFSISAHLSQALARLPCD